jgi:hypothetical protein
MKRCPFCGYEISDRSIFCSFCWKWIVPKEKVWLGVGVLIFVVLLVAGTWTSEPTAERNDFVATYNVCSEMTKAHAKFPSSYDDKWTSMNPDLFRSMGIIHVKFSVRNAFGMTIEGDSHCKIINGNLVLTDIQMEDGTRAY